MTFQQTFVAAARAEFVEMDGAKEPGAATSQSAAKTALARKLIKKYWMEGVSRSSSSAESEINARTAWSAAFISFVVRKALEDEGTAAPFDFNASHSVYIGQSIRNDFVNLSPPAFFGVPATGVGGEPPEPGDLVAWSRTTSVNGYSAALTEARRLPRPGTYFSHSDVVVDVSGGKATMIGGNVSNSVSETRITLDANGLMPVRPFRFDSAGNVISGPFIAVMKFRA